MVTGGAGFIGSHVVDRLRAGGHETRVFDLVRPPQNRPDVQYVIGDLLDREALEGAMRGCDAVVHLAAVADVDEVMSDPARADLVNVRGTQFALEAARENRVRRFVYASTIWVYGGADGNGHALGEDAPLALPSHFYTATKLAGEMYCRSYSELYGLEQTTLRFGIPYGPRSRATAVVASFVSRARAGEPLVVAGTGAQVRQFVYVEDLARGVVAAIAESTPPGTYNLVGEESTSVRAIAERVRDLVADVPIVYVEARRADVQPVRVSGALAAEVLGWRATTSFDEGIRIYVEWVRETSGSPSAAAASTIDGSAPTVPRQDPGAL